MAVDTLAWITDEFAWYVVEEHKSIVLIYVSSHSHHKT